MAFPTLSPHGNGDATCKDRRHAVTLTEANAHLLKYCVMKTSFASNNPLKYKYNCPFPDNTTWQHWAQNTAEHHRHNTQKTIFLQKNPEDDNLSEEELKKIIYDGGQELEVIISRMHRFNANIVGSHSFSQRKDAN